MPRSLWTGSLSFGLVNVPVALFSGVVDTDLHFRQLHAKDHTPVEIHRYCADEDVEVPYDEIANGYETDDDDLILLTDAELAAAAPRKNRTIDIEAFVDVEDVDPIFFDHPYVLTPAGDSEGTLRAYDEVRPTKDVPKPTKKDKPAKKEVDHAVALIEALACPWDPSRYEDTFQKRLKKIVKEKAKGKTIEVPEAEPQPSPVPDLMAALEKTLEEVKAGSR